jgi:hypothetical protein
VIHGGFISGLCSRDETFLCTDVCIHVYLLCLEPAFNFNVSCILNVTPEEDHSDVGRLGCKLCET